MLRLVHPCMYALVTCSYTSIAGGSTARRFLQCVCSSAYNKYKIRWRPSRVTPVINVCALLENMWRVQFFLSNGACQKITVEDCDCIPMQSPRMRICIDFGTAPSRVRSHRRCFHPRTEPRRPRLGVFNKKMRNCFLFFKKRQVGEVAGLSLDRS